MNPDDVRPEPEAAQLADWLPAPLERDLGPDRRQILKEQYMTEIRTRVTAEDGLARRPRRRRAVLAPVVTIAAVAVVAAVVVVATGGSGGRAAGPGTVAAPGQPQSAVQLLAMAATAAGRQAVPSVRDDQYEYVDTEVSFIVIQMTYGQDGQQRSVTTHEPLHDRRVWLPVADLCQNGLLRENGQDTVLTEKNQPGGVSCPDRGDLNFPSYRLVAALPTDPHALLATIYGAVKPGGKQGADRDSLAFTTIGDLLRESIAPPAVSAALYRAAALIPGVQVVPDAVDAAGRHGIAVARESAGVRTEWIFDRSSLLLLGERDVLTVDDYRGKAGDVIGSTAILTKAIVDTIGASR